MFIGNAAEVVMYSGPLTTAQRQAVESYLANKWGLVSKLPAGHADTATPAGLPAAVPAVMRLIFALSRFMSQVFTLSSYSLAGIANTVSLSGGTPAYVWVASVPPGAKGKNGILAVVFNLYNSSGFSANMTFDYGVYVDGVSQFMGDSTTMRYVQTASGTYAIAYGGISLGVNGIMGGLPLFFPLVLGPAASQIQIGLANSSATMTGIASSAPGYSLNILTSTGTSNTTNYVPQNTFTTTGTFTYVVPSLCSAGTVSGVYVYLWGCGGNGSRQGNLAPGGGGGYTSGFYSCAPGTTLYGVCGSLGGGNISNGGGSQDAGGDHPWSSGGGFSGIFTGSPGTGTVIGVAGGGGGAYVNGSSQSGGAGGGSNGGLPLVFGGTYITNMVAASQTAGGYTTSSGGTAGTQWIGGSVYVGGGGGWFGGSGQGGGGAGGGSGFTSNFTSGASTSNGNTATGAVGSTSLYANTLPANTGSPYYQTGYGHGGGGSGLVVIVPAVGTTATQIGVSATLFSG
jgi:hypothetical protein